jgi:hypothetical protein
MYRTLHQDCTLRTATVAAISKFRALAKLLLEFKNLRASDCRASNGTAYVARVVHIFHWFRT